MIRQSDPSAWNAPITCFPISSQNGNEPEKKSTKEKQIKRIKGTENDHNHCKTTDDSVSFTETSKERACRFECRSECRAVVGVLREKETSYWACSTRRSSRTILPRVRRRGRERPRHRFVRLRRPIVSYKVRRDDALARTSCPPTCAHPHGSLEPRPDCRSRSMPRKNRRDHPCSSCKLDSRPDNRSSYPTKTTELQWTLHSALFGSSRIIFCFDSRRPMIPLRLFSGNRDTK